MMSELCKAMMEDHQMMGDDKKMDRKCKMGKDDMRSHH